MILLGIESTCDDAAVAVLHGPQKVLSSVIHSQDAFHAKYRGVVPEIAARRHLVTLLPAVHEALNLAKLSPGDLNAIAVSTRPGLVGSLLVGAATAQSLALAWGIPCWGVNHLAAHVYSAQLSGPLPYPHIALVASGGHTLLLKVTAPNDLLILGGTLDDACGEAFDKVAKYMGLPYPGGPAIDELARNGDARAYDFPRMQVKSELWPYAFSFSGLKTAVIHQSARFQKKKEATPADLAASFQERAIGVLLGQTRLACKDLGIPRAVIVGGVSANSRLRLLTREDPQVEWCLPPLAYSTDNGAMVAGLAHALFDLGVTGLENISLLPRNPHPERIL